MSISFNIKVLLSKKKYIYQGARTFPYQYQRIILKEFQYEY